MSLLLIKKKNCFNPTALRTAKTIEQPKLSSFGCSECNRVKHFVSLIRAAENRTRWKGIVVKSSMVPQLSCKIMGLIESVMELRPRQGNFRLVFRLFSLMGGLPSVRIK